MKHLTRQLRRYRLESVLAPLFKMLEALFDLLVPLVVAGIINQGIALQDEGYVWRQVGLLALMAAVGLIASFFGFSPPEQGLIIALYVATDGFGTACNITGDGAIALIVDRLARKR